jgi:hypothetical protein
MVRGADVSLGEWLVLALACAVGTAGLFLAASQSGGTTYTIGLALFIGAVAYVFRLVKRHFDRIDAMRH